MSLAVVTILGLLVVVVLTVVYLKFRSHDALEELMKKRGDAKVAAYASFVEGPEEIPVALSLTDAALFYENPDMEARVDLERIEEIEYDDELSTAKEVKDGRVLRVRAHGHTIEFILDAKTAERFVAHLPPHRMGEPDRVHAI